uniref:AAA-ATPase n=1 Tax=Pseudomonas phage Arace01 TaxID=3138526 RepID=A0AAU6VZR9_9VIRU
MDENFYRCKPRKIKEYIRDCIYAGLVPYVQSSPGMGKSTIMEAIANEENLHMIDHRLSTSAPEDMSGLPQFQEGLAKFAPFADLFPLQDAVIPNGKDGFMLFLDEFNSAKREVQAASYKLILDKKVGQHRLHDRLVITAAGNLSTDRAIVNPIGTAMQSRVIHLEMEIDFDEWLMDVALPQEWDSRVIAYLSQYPSKLMDFKPDHNEKTFCCPRTWDFVNRIAKTKDKIEVKDTALYGGCITSGTAADFVQFTQVYANMVKIEDILRDPVNCYLPGDANTRWATISAMMEKVTEDNFEKMAIYANRFDLSFRVLFFRSAHVRNPKLRSHPAFRKAMSEVSKYIHLD